MKAFPLILLFFFIVKFAITQLPDPDSLRHELTIAKEDTNKVNTLCEMSAKYAWAYADTAIMYAQQALELAGKLKYEEGIIIAQNKMSAALITLGDYPAALDYAFKALDLSQKLHNTEMIAVNTAQIGGCYMELGDYNNSLYYHYKALKLFEKLQDKFNAAITWSSIGQVYVRKNQPDSAIFYAKKSYKVINYWPTQLMTQGDAYLEKKNYDSALYFYRIGLDLSINLDLKKDFIDVDNNIAFIQKNKDNIDSAIWYSKKALTERGGNTYPLGLLKAATMLTNLYELQNKPDSAFKYLKVSFSLKESLFSREKTISIQSLVFKEKEKQKEIAASRLKYQNQLKMYALLGGVIALLLISGILLRSNRHKQKAKTKIENAYTELKSTQAQLVQREKMASLGELTAGIAHEIQNPLNFVNNFSEVNTELLVEMKDEMDKGNLDDAKTIANDVIDNEQKINHHGKRADAIVKNMLQHSRSSNAVKELTDINKLADEYLRLAYHGLRAKDKSFNATTKTNFDDSIGKINIVPQDIGRVILNLITNAFYAVTEKNASTSSAGQQYEPTVSVSTKKINGKVELSVKDNGNGIPKKVLDKIFQPFFTTKPTGQGTGLGLSLSYDIVKAHGGEIKVETKENEGSEFIIQLPISV